MPYAAWEHLAVQRTARGVGHGAIVEAQFALVAASEHFVELREGLPPYRVG